MREQEFSLPREEFSTPPGEFTPPAGEFAPPGREHHLVGQEFGQSARQSRKKQRSVNPLMLTTAAAVTAAVVLSGSGETPVRQQGPTHQLSAENRAYVEEIDDALLAQNSDALLALSLDGRIQRIFAEELLPFEESLAGTEYENFNIYSVYVNDLNPTIGESYNSTFDYLGEGVLVTPNSPRDLGFMYYLAYQIDVDRTTGERFPYPRSVELSCYENRDHEHRMESFRSRSFLCYPNEDGTVDFWEMKDYLCRELEGESAYYAPPYEGSFTKYDAGAFMYDPVLQVMEGEFAQDTKTFSHDTYEATYLHNGTVTLFRLENGQWVREYVLEVRDGRAILQDGIFVRKNPSNVDWYSLDALLGDGNDHMMTDDSFLSEEDALYHSFRIY